MITDYFRAQIEGRQDYPCMAVQGAIDELATEFRDDRANMLSAISDLTRGQLLDLVLVAYAHAPLTLATGKSRCEWIDIIEADSRKNPNA